MDSGILKNLINQKSVSAFLVGLVLIVTSFLYFPGLSGQFLFDDYPNIVNNKAIQVSELSFQRLIPAALSYGGSENFFRAISMLSFAYNYYLIDGLNPFLFKLTNLIIHLINVFGIFVLVRLWLQIIQGKQESARNKFQTQWLPFIVSAVWAFHPVNVTTVLYVVQRMNGLSALFVIWGMFLYSFGRLILDEKGWRGAMLMLASVVVCGPLAFFSKENGILLPLFLLLIELFFFDFAANTYRKKCFVRFYIFIFIVVPILFGFIYLCGNYTSLMRAYGVRNFTLEQRLLTEARVLFFYLKLILFPQVQDFTLYHDDFLISGGLFSPATSLCSIFGLSGLLITAILLRNKHSLFSFGILFFLAGHLVESTVIPLEIIHEHRNYIPSFGIVLSFFSMVTSVHLNKISTSVKYFVFASALGILFMVTSSRVDNWGNARQLLEKGALNHPKSYRSQYQLGNFYLNAMLFSSNNEKINKEKALKHLSLAADLIPYGKGSVNLSIVQFYAITEGAIGSGVKNEILANLSGREHSATMTRNMVSLLECLAADVCHLPLETIKKLILAYSKNENASSKDIAKVYAAAINVFLQEKHYNLALKYSESAVSLDHKHLQHRINYAKILIVFGEFEKVRKEIILIESADRYGSYESSIENLKKMLSGGKAPVAQTEKIADE